MTSHAYETFIATVQHVGRVPRARAERAARATLETLAERISKGQARDLAQQLPPELAGFIATTSDPEPFGFDEFLRRLAERERTSVETAERHARAVFAALGRTVSDEEIADLVAELPQDFEPLSAEAQRRFVRVMPGEVFVQRVAEHAGLSPGDARRAIDAVLETLAERISAGEVDDMIALLPPELHPPLEHGKAASGREDAKRMSLDAFVERVAQRQGVGSWQAHESADAVFAALREALPHEEFVDVTAQLPPQYAAIGARP